MARKRLPPKPKKDHPDRLRQSPGAPPLDIDPEEIRKMARRKMSVTAIAEIFDCDRHTICRRVSAQEINALRLERGHKLLDATYMRAMGGKVEEKQPDGTVMVRYLKSSDRMMETALKYYVGTPAQVVEINPNPDRPANLNSIITEKSIEAILDKLEQEY